MNEDLKKRLDDAQAEYDLYADALAKAEAAHQSMEAELADLKRRWPRLLVDVAVGKADDDAKNQHRDRMYELEDALAESDALLPALGAQTELSWRRLQYTVNAYQDEQRRKKRAEVNREIARLAETLPVDDVAKQLGVKIERVREILSRQSLGMPYLDVA